MKKLIAALIAVSCSISVAAQDSVYRDWSKPYFVRLDAGFSGTEFHARWDISRCDCGDLHILAEETLPDEILKGEQVLLDSKVLLVKGYETYTGPLSGVLDSPVLMMQLLFVLLQESAPSGPSSVIDELIPDISEAGRLLKVDSGIAYGAFPPPWSVSGKVSPMTAGQYRFDIHFSFELPGVGEQWIDLSGVLDYAERPFPVDDNMILDGWSAAWLELDTENHDGMTPGMTLGKFKESF
jgi:hypothetical protein